MNIPQAPLITGSSNLSTLQTNIVLSKSLFLSKTSATIPSGTFSSITNINQNQGTVRVTFTAIISASTRSSGTLTLQMINDGPKLSETSLVFLNVINTVHVSGIPYFSIIRILPAGEGIQNGQITLYVSNIDTAESINVNDYLDLSFLIIN
jgi:hypothetical protein